jgi:hypothetical protein
MGQAELGVGYMFDLAQQPDGLHHEGLHPGIDAFDLMRLNVIGFDNLAQTVQQGVRDAAVRVGLVGCSLGKCQAVPSSGVIFSGSQRELPMILRNPKSASSRMHHALEIVNHISCLNVAA